MDTRSAETMLDQLRALMTTAIAAALDVAAADAAWATPYAHSPAGAELAAEELRRPAPRDGSWPWLGAPLTARWAIWVMIEEAEEAKALPPLLKPDVTSYAADVLCRAVLEAASLAWWLLDPGIGAQRRAARWLAWRLHTARQTENGIKALEIDPGEDPGDYGESVADVQQEIDSLGWSEVSGTTEFGGEKEPRIGYTSRVAELAGATWPQRELSYRLLSAVAHAELLGLSRNLTAMRPGMSLPRPASGPETAIWLWHDAYLVLGALVLTASRAAGFLGLGNQGATLNALIQDLSRALPALRPTGL